MNNYNNLFKAGYIMPWRYPKNWIENIKHPFYNFKYIIQRAKKGFCSLDIWDFDTFLTHVLIDGLRELANTAHGYPGNEEYPTYESWINDLNKYAQLLENSLEESNTYINKYKEEYDKYLLSDNFNFNSRNEISNKYFEEEQKIRPLREIDKKKALFWIVEHFDSLWD